MAPDIAPGPGECEPRLLVMVDLEEANKELART